MTARDQPKFAAWAAADWSYPAPDAATGAVAAVVEGRAEPPLEGLAAGLLAAGFAADALAAAAFAAAALVAAAFAAAAPPPPLPVVCIRNPYPSSLVKTGDADAPRALIRAKRPLTNRRTRLSGLNDLTVTLIQGDVPTVTEPHKVTRL